MSRKIDLSITHAAKSLGVSVGTVRRWADRDHDPLPHYRTPGGQRRFNQQDLDAFLERLRRG